MGQKGQRIALLWSIFTALWVLGVLNDQPSAMRAWTAYHFNFAAVQAAHKAAIQADVEERNRLLSQIESAASEAAGKARASNLWASKVDSQLLDHIAASAAEKARAKKTYELTHPNGPGPHWLSEDRQRELLLSREPDINDPPPRPPSGWLFYLLIPPVAVAILLIFVIPMACAVLHRKPRSPQ